MSLRGAPACGRQVATKPCPERSEGTLEIATPACRNACLPQSCTSACRHGLCPRNDFVGLLHSARNDHFGDF